MSRIAPMPPPTRLSPFWMLVALAALSECAYLAILCSSQSLHVVGDQTHSLPFLLALFAGCFGLYLAAAALVRRCEESRSLLALILGTAVVFRITLWAADPIEEIDLYRYLWDGNASVQGVDPFRYAPQQALAISPDDAQAPPDLARLSQAVRSSPELQEIATRVHFGQLPTIYPPVSQAVFAAAVAATPRDASVAVRMLVMKGAFLAFDLATLGLCVLLLRQAGIPSTWCIEYAWCPLVIKEFANSGHLDSLAVFFTMLALWWAGSVWLNRSRMAAYGAATALAFGVGAKLYPLVLAPLILAAIARGLGLRRAIGPAILFAALSLLILVPMRPRGELAELPIAPAPYPAVPMEDSDSLPLPPEADTDPRDATQSLRAFLSEWEMNDFLFLLTIENIRPNADTPPDQRAWFAVAPEAWRELAVAWSERCGVSRQRAPFLLTRALTSLGFLALLNCLTASAGRASSWSRWLECAFLALAWFWLILPTGNPWYLTWCLPLLPFVHNRAWMLLSGLAFLYYVRFWLVACFPTPPVLGTPYSGALFFDFVVTWCEFGLWFLVLIASARNRHSTTGQLPT